MVQPQPHGYPDWGRYSAAADKVLAKDTLFPQAGNKDYGPLFVGDVPAMNLQADCSGQGIQIRFQFYDDAALTNILAQQVIDLPAGKDTDIVIPVLGPWLLMRVLVQAAGGNYEFTLSTCFGQRTGLGASFQRHILASVVSGAVGAGATVTTAVNSVHPGWASLVWDTSFATWLGVLEAIDYVGTLTRIDTQTNNSPRTARTLFLPQSGLQLRFTNTTAGAGNFTVHLLGLPGWPGS